MKAAAWSKLAFSVALVAWLLWRIPAHEIATALSRLELASFALGLAISLAAWWLSAARLWVLVPEFRLRDVIRMTFVGLYYGTVLPGQVAGDIMKAYRLSPGQSAPGRAAAATFIDRVVATWALFLAGSCAAPWVGQAPKALGIGLGVVTLSTLGVFALFMSHRLRGVLLRALSRGPSEGIRALPARFASGVDLVLREPGRLFANLAGALVFHALCVSIHQVVAPSLGIELPFAAWWLVYAGVSLLVLAPVTIAGLGLREGGYVGLLGLFGVAAPAALSLSLVFFAYSLCGALLGFAIELTSRRP